LISSNSYLGTFAKTYFISIPVVFKWQEDFIAWAHSMMYF